MYTRKKEKKKAEKKEEKSEAVFLLSYSSGPNRLRSAHMRRMRRSISTERSASWWMMPPRYKNWVACLYLRPAALIFTSGEAGYAWSPVRTSIISVFFSDTVRPPVSKTVAMTVFIFRKSPRRLRDSSCVACVRHAPHCPLCFSHACQWHLFSVKTYLVVNTW